MLQHTLVELVRFNAEALPDPPTLQVVNAPELA